MAIAKSMRARIEMAAKIKARLELKGWSLSRIDREYQLPTNTAATTLREPNLRGERAIAAVLKTHPHLLWRERYHGDGRRKDPQPMENYVRPPTRKQRRVAERQEQEAA